MSSKTLPEDIDSKTVTNWRKLLLSKQHQILKDKSLLKNLSALKDFIQAVEDKVIGIRAVEAAEAVSAMSEEERRMLSMRPDEKKFFLQYKAEHPDDPWTYFKAYQKMKQSKYRLKQKAQ